MTFTKWIVLLVIGLYFNTSLSAQYSILSSGGDIKNSSGSVSYAVGQVFFDQQNASNASQIQGVLQPYEISLITAVNQPTQKFTISISPNPANDFLVIEMDDVQNNLFAQLFDGQGKLIATHPLTSLQNRLKIDHLSPNIYFIKITQNNQFIQTVKVVKH